MRNNLLVYVLETRHLLGIVIIRTIIWFGIRHNSRKSFSSEFWKWNFVAGLQRYAGPLNVFKPRPLDSSQDKE